MVDFERKVVVLSMPTTKRFCEHCGASVSEEANFCSKCGGDLHGYAATSDILVCQNCGHSMEINPDDETIAECPACGSKKLIRNEHKIRMRELDGKEKESKRSFKKWLVDSVIGKNPALFSGFISIVFSLFVGSPHTYVFLVLGIVGVLFGLLGFLAKL